MAASPYPQGVSSTRFWQADDEAVDVWTLDKPLSIEAASAFVAYTSPISGLRPTRFEGHPAVRALVPCFVPSGTCSGYYGELDVVAGSTMYSVFINGLDELSTARLLAEFRIVG